MMRVIPELLSTLAQFFPPWILGLLALLIAPVAVFAWLRWLRAKQIRGALRTVFFATDPTKRQAAVDRAFRLAGKREQALIALADTAHQTGLPGVTHRALAQLDALGLGRKDVARIRAATSKPARRAGHPVEELVVIERFIAEGLTEAARTRLAEALSRFPTDPDLLALNDTLHTDRSPPGIRHNS